ncbi:DUF3187 family protein [Ferrimonas futtsuensis]|uniref:DUF3187 family protein n=1 Tax=Ferrimonas futtsuensis TaxID=364764 RepID=UPI00048247BB|nr:DUF3187 family protein [Ferrimonas futtsuensis]
MKAVWILGGLVVAVAPAYGRYWADGPMMVRSQAPLKSLVLSPIFRPARYTQGDLIADAAIYAASIWAIDDEYVMDYYTIQYRFSLLWSPSDRWQLGASIASHTTDDAHLDQLTLSFHKLFGIDQNGRTDVPKHRSYLEIPKADLLIEDFSGQAIGRQLELSLGYALYRHRRHDLSSTVVLAYEDDTNPRSGGGWDGSIQLDYQYAWRNNTAYLMGAVAWTDGDALFGFELETSSWHWGMGYRRQFGDRHQLLLEYNAADGILPDLGEFAKPVHEISLGYRYQVRNLALEGVIMENFKHPDNSADVALVAKIRYKF